MDMDPEKFILKMIAIILISLVIGNFGYFLGTIQDETEGGIISDIGAILSKDVPRKVTTEEFSENDVTLILRKIPTRIECVNGQEFLVAIDNDEIIQGITQVLIMQDNILQPKTCKK